MPGARAWATCSCRRPSSVYGLNPALPKSEREWVRPLSPYAVSKLAGEQYLLAYQHSFGLETLAFAEQLVDFGVLGGLVVDVLLVAVVVWWFREDRRRGPAGWLAVACGVGIAVQLGSCLVEASYEGGFLRTLMWLSWGLLLALYESERERVTRPGPDAYPQRPRPRGPRRRASGRAAARGS